MLSVKCLFSFNKLVQVYYLIPITAWYVNQDHLRYFCHKGTVSRSYSKKIQTAMKSFSIFPDWVDFEMSQLLGRWFYLANLLFCGPTEDFFIYKALFLALVLKK